MRSNAIPCLLLALAACQTPPASAEKGEPDQAERAAPAAADEAAAEDADPAEASPESNEARLERARAHAQAQGDALYKVEPLTEEDQRLIDADPATLSPEEATARSYALRKKILQDPNSPQAKSLREAADQIVHGEIDPNLDYKDKGQSSPPSE